MRKWTGFQWQRVRSSDWELCERRWSFWVPQTWQYSGYPWQLWACTKCIATSSESREIIMIVRAEIKHDVQHILSHTPWLLKEYIYIWIFQHCPLVLLVRATLRWWWVWRIGGNRKYSEKILSTYPLYTMNLDLTDLGLNMATAVRGRRLADWVVAMKPCTNFALICI